MLPVGAAVDAMGIRLSWRSSPVGLKASLRPTPQPRLLHHVPGRPAIVKDNGANSLR
jgi:hypothetical protein